MTAEAFGVLARDEFTGKQFGRFEVLCKLGEGGMSQVFLAWQKSVGGFRRPVVLKRILEAIRHDQAFLRMFLQEAKITSGLNHTNIASLHDLSNEGGELFMVMEFVPGATLVEVAKACALSREAIPIGLTLAVVRDTALALHYAHHYVNAAGRARPVIHRDIAEKNIMVSLDGATKLLDFGIARQEGRNQLTQVGMVKGTAGYMSPEQVRGEPLDGRTDVFSLGVVLHECLTGQRLFSAEARVDEVHALLHAPIPAPSQRNRNVAMPLDSVVLKALARDKEHRYASARELAVAVEWAAGQELWPPEKRAAFIQRHFAARQQQLQALLGDPGKTDLGELLEEPGPVRKAPPRDQRATVSLRKVTPDPIAASAATLGSEPDDETQTHRGPGLASRSADETMGTSGEVSGEVGLPVAPEDDGTVVDLQVTSGGRARREPREGVRPVLISPHLLALAGTGAVVLAVLLMLALSRC